LSQDIVGKREGGKKGRREEGKKKEGRREKGVGEEENDFEAILLLFR